MPKIKTREIHKGSIKTIDRAQDLSARMRTVEPKTKGSRSPGNDQESSSIAAYGERRTSSMVKYAGGKTAETMDAASHWGARKIQERRRLIQSRREFANSVSLLEDAVPDSNVSKSMSKPLPGELRVAASRNVAGKAGVSIAKAGTRAAEALLRKVQAEQSFRAARKLAERRIRKQTEKAAQLQARQSKRIVRDAGKAVRRIGLSLKHLTESTKALSGLFFAGGWVAVLIIMVCILFGAAFYYFGDSSADTSYTPVSPEVEAYTPEITAAAKKYGIEDYVELIKAVMMQESSGRGGDPMQCSASGYNRTGKKITDPKVSIDVGVHTLAACIKSAGVKDSTDLDRIKLAAQGYNFGNGYIDWAKKKYGGYSAANAAEFSSRHAGKSGTYGDKLYAEHVLRYYPYGNYEIGLGNGNIVNIARAQLGNKGGAKFWSWYGFHSRVEWCACFVSWCADQGGYLKSGTIPRFSIVSDGANWFKAKHQWQSRTYKPAPGDIIFFTWSGGPLQHVGIVEKCNGKVVTTIEGNSTDACRRRTYPVGSSCIAGYGTPAYPDSSSGSKAQSAARGMITASQVADIAAKLDRKYASEHWTYNGSHPQDSHKTINCVRFTQNVYAKLGVRSFGWYTRHGRINSSKGLKDLENAGFSYRVIGGSKGMTVRDAVKNGYLRPGDIVGYRYKHDDGSTSGGYATHTELYVGTKSGGKYLFYDYGPSFVKKGTGRHWRKARRIGCVIRYEGLSY